jgi:hypothetical protein
MIALPTMRGVLTFPQAFDPDYQAVLNRATALGYALPTLGQQVLQNTLMLGLKSSGAFAKLDVFYMFANNGGGPFATLNWKNPLAHQCSLVNAPLFTSNVGFSSDGATSFIDTNYNPQASAINTALNDACRAFWLHTVSGGTASLLGVTSTAADRYTLDSVATGVTRLHAATGATTPTIITNLTGFWAQNKTSSTTYEIFRNTTQTPATVGAASAFTNENRLILRSAAQYTNSAARVSMYLYGASLVSENTNLYNAINTYMGAI